ncbi:MAG: metal ABC transporter ATP-binding protein [Candidatus Spechtbacterales bacterium]
MEENVIQVKGLSFSYGANEVLSDISFGVPKGSITFIVGPNGSGKTTLLKLLLGLLKPSQGEINVFGKSPREIRKDVGYVPQRFQFEKSFPLNVIEFLELAAPDADSDDVQKHMEHLNIKHLKDTKIGELSGGQFQRVLIARSMLHHPKILYLDEPVSGVDVSGEETIYDMVKFLQKTHDVTIVMISHELDVVQDVADRVVCINKELVCDGVPAQALTSEVMKSLYGSRTALHDHSAHH